MTEDRSIGGRPGHRRTRPGRRPSMAESQSLRVDAYGLLPTLLIVLMLLLASLGVIAHAAAI